MTDDKPTLNYRPPPPPPPRGPYWFTDRLGSCVLTLILAPLFVVFLVDLNRTPYLANREHLFVAGLIVVLFAAWVAAAWGLVVLVRAHRRATRRAREPYEADRT